MRGTEKAPAAAPARPRLYGMAFATVYPLYVAKVERKGRTRQELDTIIRWLTGYDRRRLEAQVRTGADLEAFFANAPHLNPSRSMITGVVCGVRVETIEDPVLREIRYLDKLVDELARGRALEKILRS